MQFHLVTLEIIFTMSWQICAYQALLIIRRWNERIGQFIQEPGACVTLIDTKTKWFMAANDFTMSVSSEGDPDNLCQSGKNSPKNGAQSRYMVSIQGGESSRRSSVTESNSVQVRCSTTSPGRSSILSESELGPRSSITPERNVDALLMDSPHAITELPKPKGRRLSFAETTKDTNICVISPSPHEGKWVPPTNAERSRLFRNAEKSKLYRRRHGKPLPEEYLDSTPEDLRVELNSIMMERIRQRRMIRKEQMSLVNKQRLETERAVQKLRNLRKCPTLETRCLARGYCTEICTQQIDTGDSSISEDFRERK